MEHQNFSKYVVLAIAVFFIVTGDYASFFHHIKTVI
jgi:hypothetical protein